MGTYIVGAVVLGCILLAARSVYNTKKNSNGCGGCEGCGKYKTCEAAENK